MPAPFDRECEFEVEHRTAVVPDFQSTSGRPLPSLGCRRHLGPYRPASAPPLPAPSLWLRAPDLPHPENLVTLSDVKVVPSHQTRTTPTSNCFFRKAGHPSPNQTRPLRPEAGHHPYLCSFLVRRRQSIQLTSQPHISSSNVFQDVGAILGNAARARKSLVEVSMFSALSNVDHWLSPPLLPARVIGAPFLAGLPSTMLGPVKISLLTLKYGRRLRSDTSLCPIWNDGPKGTTRAANI